jgi:hypothetical protein
MSWVHYRLQTASIRKRFFDLAIAMISLVSFTFMANGYSGKNKKSSRLKPHTV